jgi:nucleoside-diphosphate-sugar epimerase
MKYLVTGATGLLGNNIVRQLLAAGEKVRVLARTTSDPRPLDGLTVERAEGDVRDAVAVARACHDVQVVIHSAGCVQIGWTQLDLHRRINVEGTRNVATAARGAGAKLVHVSSINALGLGRLAQPADEETALPGIIQCPYVVTKREAEQIVRDEMGRGLAAIIVNPSFMLGPWDWKPSSGKMLLAVTRFAPSAPVGAANFCDVRDVASAIIAGASRGKAGRQFVLGGHNLTYWDAWRQMARSAGKRGPFLPMGPLFRGIVGPVLDLHTWLTGREGDANSAAIAMGRQEHCFSSRRAESELGYRSRPLDETLADTWEWFRKHGYV